MLSIFAEKTKLLTYVIFAIALFSFMPKNDIIAFVYSKERIYEGTHEIIVVGIHDGDTMTVEIPEFPAIIGERISLRLDGIDTPEITDKRAEIKAKAIAAKAYVIKRVKQGTKIEITGLKRDKYFRIDAQVVIDGINLNKMLLEEGLAKPYDGGRKSPW